MTKFYDLAVNGCDSAGGKVVAPVMQLLAIQGTPISALYVSIRNRLRAADNHNRHDALDLRFKGAHEERFDATFENPADGCIYRLTVTKES